MPTPKKAYCFTLNNYTQDEYDHIHRFLGSEASYGIVGKETGASGTPHLQGYVLFKKSYQFRSIKDRLNPRCHIEVANGDAFSNRTYCSKDGNYVEYGVIPSRKRSRDELAQHFSTCMSSGGGGLGQFHAEHPGVYLFSGHNMLRNFLAAQPTIERPDIRVLWIHGPPGTGKSREAHETYPQAFVKEPRTKWWSGYALEEEVIIDDFGPGGIDINHLLRWFDRYKCLVETKGGMIPLYATKFIVTSNFSPTDVFTSQDYPNPQLPALLRRIVIKEKN